jgi:hypothetical protein
LGDLPVTKRKKKKNHNGLRLKNKRKRKKGSRADIDLVNQTPFLVIDNVAADSLRADA